MTRPTSRIRDLSNKLGRFLLLSHAILTSSWDSKAAGGSKLDEMPVVLSRAKSSQCLVSWLRLVNFSQSNIELSYLVLKSENKVLLNITGQAA